MENKIILLIALTVAVVGCSDLPTGNNNGNPDDQQQQEGQGLEIVELRTTDNTLRPGQSAKAVLRLKNYHTEDVSIINNTLINTGVVETSDKSCSPSEIQPAEEGLTPEMRCEWDLTVPEDVDISTDQKAQSMTLYLKYDSSLTLVRPLELEFKEFDDINSTSTITRSFSNGEVEGSLSVESPATLQGRTADFTIQEVGDGRVASPYSFEYYPQQPQTFDGCPDQDEPVVGNQLEFSCTLEADSVAARNLYFSAYYKYAKEPTLNINIVNN